MRSSTAVRLPAEAISPTLAQPGLQGDAEACRSPASPEVHGSGSLTHRVVAAFSDDYTKLPTIGRELSSRWQRPALGPMACWLLLLQTLVVGAACYHYGTLYVHVKRDKGFLQDRMEFTDRHVEQLQRQVQRLQRQALQLQTSGAAEVQSLLEAEKQRNASEEHVVQLQQSAAEREAHLRRYAEQLQRKAEEQQNATEEHVVQLQQSAAEREAHLRRYAEQLQRKAEEQQNATEEHVVQLQQSAAEREAHLRRHAEQLQRKAEQQRNATEKHVEQLQQSAAEREAHLKRFAEQLQQQGAKREEQLRRNASETEERLRRHAERLTEEYRAGCPTSCSACALETPTLLLLDGQSSEPAEVAELHKVAEPRKNDGLYKAITGLQAHQLPEMYGKVQEKTIWSYWYHPEDCPSSQRCVLPTVVELCVETIRRNRGGFDFKIVHSDEVDKYVNRLELPLRWNELKPAQQKDSLMNALLARYGGVAMDISTVLLRPLDNYWAEMVASGATFRGYMYRLNGRSWRHAEVTAVWFLMSRREGVFSTAVRNQVIGMGDRADTSAYNHMYLALGDQTLTPILSMFNYSLPKCYDDPAVNVDPSSKLHQFGDQDPRMCPEREQRPWYKELTGPARNDTKLLLQDPRDGPQLPFAFEGMTTWNISDSRRRNFQRTPGAPMQGEDCASMKECWEDVLLRRYHAPAELGRAHKLSFVKLFKHAQELSGKSRKEILADRSSYFYQMLKLAGVVQDS